MFNVSRLVVLIWVLIIWNAYSLNPENQTTVQDNSVLVQMSITAASGLSVDPIGYSYC